MRQPGCLRVTEGRADFGSPGRERHCRPGSALSHEEWADRRKSRHAQPSGPGRAVDIHLDNLVRVGQPGERRLCTMLCPKERVPTSALQSSQPWQLETGTCGKKGAAMDMREMMRCSKRVDPEPDLPMHFSFRCGITVVSKVVKPSSVTTNARITRPISASPISRALLMRAPLVQKPAPPQSPGIHSQVESIHAEAQLRLRDGPG